MGDQEAMMRRHPAFESGDQFGSGALQARRAELGQLCRVRLARCTIQTSSFSMR
jgi:hypothetical protein